MIGPMLTSRPQSDVARRLNDGAFTLLEICAAIIILLVLAAIFLPNYRAYIDRAAEVKCTGNLRTISIALHGRLQDHGDVWPQGPSLADEKNWEQFWITTLLPYGVEPTSWKCPTIAQAYTRSQVPAPEHPEVHYVPTMFTDEPGISMRWPTQPWLVERSDAHGKGPLLCFPDGSVKSASRVVAELGQP